MRNVARRTMNGAVLLLLVFFVRASRAQDGPRNTFYTTTGGGAELLAIHVNGNKITTRDIGPTSAPFCASLAMAPWHTLYSMCGPLFGTQHLATIDQRTGKATLFGVGVSGLAVMAMTFAPNGLLYAVGDCNPNANFECTPGSDPTYNSLYTVDVTTGTFSRVGSTGAPQFFMDLAIDRNGRLFGVTSTVFPSALPAFLYQVNLKTGTATKVVNLVGSTAIMGLAFDLNGELYATDFVQNPGLYRIDIKTGFEQAIAALPFAFSSGLEPTILHITADQ